MGFLDPLVVRWTGDNLWILEKELRYVPEEGPQITVPAGSETDLASIPQILWAVLPPAGQWARASVLHDWLYRTGCFGPDGRRKCDRLFWEAMKHDDVDEYIRDIIYKAVRGFGKGSYKG